MCSRVSWLRTQILCSQQLFQSFFACLRCAALFYDISAHKSRQHALTHGLICIECMCIICACNSQWGQVRMWECVCVWVSAGVCECSMYFALTLKAICKFRGCNYVCCVVSWPVCPSASFPLNSRQPFASVTLMLCLCRHPLTYTLAFSIFFLFSMRLYWLLLVCCGLLAVAALPALWRPHRLPSAPPRAVLNARLFIVFLTTSQIHICA